MARIVRLKHLKIGDEIKIFQKPIEFKDRPDVVNKWLKLVYFSVREGLIKTFEKIR